MPLKNTTTNVLSITGVVAAGDGAIRTFYNSGDASIALDGENTASLPANRFGYGFLINPRSSVQIIYNAAISRWEAFS